MARKMLTEEEIRHLKASRYVLDATPSIVHFSAEFKELFWNSLMSGKSPRQIVTELGIDPDILGATRLNGLKTMIRNEVRAGKGFRDLTTYGKYLNNYVNPDVIIKHLEQRLEYKDQEIEFLKKIAYLGKGAKES